MAQSEKQRTKRKKWRKNTSYQAPRPSQLEVRQSINLFAPQGRPLIGGSANWMAELGKPVPPKEEMSVEQLALWDEAEQLFPLICPLCGQKLQLFDGLFAHHEPVEVACEYTEVEELFPNAL